MSKQKLRVAVIDDFEKLADTVPAYAMLKERAEVTLWAVDEGVLALTGYRAPDPIDLIYQPRGLGMRLASTLTTVAPQIAEGEKGKRAPGGGGGREGARDYLVGSTVERIVRPSPVPVLVIK